jgi:hypothetical protein
VVTGDKSGGLNQDQVHHDDKHRAEHERADSAQRDDIGPAPVGHGTPGEKHECCSREHAQHQSAGAGSTVASYLCDSKKSSEAAVRTEHKNRKDDAHKIGQNLVKSKEIALKLCINEIDLATNLSSRNHHLRFTQTQKNIRSSQEHGKVPQNKNRRFLRAQIDSTKLTVRIASTHVIARINTKRTTQLGLEMTK